MYRYFAQINRFNCDKNSLKVLIYLFVTLNLMQFSFGSQKRWIQNMNYDNPDNWAEKRIPCAYDAISFPTESSPVTLGTPITATEINLPRNGELLLGDKFSLSALSDDVTATATCQPGGHSMFNRSWPLDWHDPGTWCQLGDGKYRYPNMWFHKFVVSGDVTMTYHVMSSEISVLDSQWR